MKHLAIMILTYLILLFAELMRSQDYHKDSNELTPTKKSLSSLKSQPNLLNSPCYNAAK